MMGRRNGMLENFLKICFLRNDYCQVFLVKLLTLTIRNIIIYWNNLS